MARHELTLEESSKGGRNRYAAELRLEKVRFKHQQRMAELQVMQTIASNPVAVSSAIYLGVGFLKTGQKPPPNQTPMSQFMQDWRHNFGQFLQTVGVPAMSLSGNSNDSLGIDELRAALLVNIASGGNLAGVLTGASSIGANVLKAFAK